MTHYLLPQNQLPSEHPIMRSPTSYGDPNDEKVGLDDEDEEVESMQKRKRFVYSNMH